LIEPVSDLLSQQERLIIIPDDELNYIPFEALQDPSGAYLVKDLSIQYQYSASLLEKRKRALASQGILSFAPFASSTSNGLPHSADEIKELKGKQYLDDNATKDNFLNEANTLSVIHLATHAQVNDIKPSQSYISFAGTDSTTNKLYAQEIYDLSLDSTALIVLSACETGTGQLVHGEGMMSLSRAFAYAGCPNIVTSLWKAEDQTTAFLTRRFHFYLDDKKTTDEALHLAKLDLLKSNEIDERLKTPNYWAHIIFIGEYEKRSSSIFNWGFALPVLLIVFVVYLTQRRRAARNST
jgi:CHAT domain-containing protein